MKGWKVSETIGIPAINSRKCFIANGPTDQIKELYRAYQETKMKELSVEVSKLVLI